MVEIKIILLGIVSMVLFTEVFKKYIFGFISLSIPLFILSFKNLSIDYFMYIIAISIISLFVFIDQNKEKTSDIIYKYGFILIFTYFAFKLDSILIFILLLSASLSIFSSIIIDWQKKELDTKNVLLFNFLNIVACIFFFLFMNIKTDIFVFNRDYIVTSLFLFLMVNSFGIIPNYMNKQKEINSLEFAKKLIQYVLLPIVFAMCVQKYMFEILQNLSINFWITTTCLLIAVLVINILTKPKEEVVYKVSIINIAILILLQSPLNINIHYIVASVVFNFVLIACYQKGIYRRKVDHIICAVLFGIPISPIFLLKLNKITDLKTVLDSNNIIVFLILSFLTLCFYPLWNLVRENE